MCKVWHVVLQQISCKSVTFHVHEMSSLGGNLSNSDDTVKYRVLYAFLVFLLQLQLLEELVIAYVHLFRLELVL